MKSLYSIKEALLCIPKHDTVHEEYVKTIDTIMHVQAHVKPLLLQNNKHQILFVFYLA